MSSRVAVVALAVSFAFGARAADGGWSTLDVAGEKVRIYREAAFGVPHVFAETNRGLFTAFGWVAAQDRLWQMEVSRRAARGRLAEILGPGSLPADVDARTNGYTETELEAQVTALPDDVRAMFEAYAAGVNRWISEVAAVPDASGELRDLPFEFHYFGIGVPQPFQPSDSVAMILSISRQFGEAGGREQTNKASLDAIRANLDRTRGARPENAALAWAIFQDLRWLNDPAVPGTVPASGAIAPRQHAAHPSQLAPWAEEPPSIEAQRDAASAILEELGVPAHLGSFGWVVSPARTATGDAMLLGGPQMNYSTPEIVFEVQLKDDEGFDVAGMAFPGIPMVVIGRNAHLAWTLTSSPSSDVEDIYAETPCERGGAPGYAWNDGTCRLYAARWETIAVKGRAPVSLQVLRSVHGPVVASTATLAFASRRATFMREAGGFARLLDMARATNVGAFAEAVAGITQSFNVLYADRVGNIGYWLAGCNPVKPDGFDPRLPLPGDGTAEWPGGCREKPFALNPAQGWLGSWNNPPSADWTFGDQNSFGRMHRVNEVFDLLRANDHVSVEDLHAFARSISRHNTAQTGREAPFLLPYLLDGLDAYPPSHPLAPRARAVLESWDGYQAAGVQDAYFQPGEVVFQRWLARMLERTFSQEMGTVASSSNMLLHVLDDALGPGSSVPVAYVAAGGDYFGGEDPRRVISASFDAALADLGPDPAAWESQLRLVITFRHPAPPIGVVGTALRGARPTWSQIVAFDPAETRAESVVTLGQSGFIRWSPDGRVDLDRDLDPHFRDQLPLFQSFRYKPLPLYRNTQLKE